LYSIGKSVKGRDLWVMVVSSSPYEHMLGIFSFKVRLWFTSSFLPVGSQKLKVRPLKCTLNDFHIPSIGVFLHKVGWNCIVQWKISYEKRNLLAKIDLSGIQKPTGELECPLYGSSYPKVVLKILKGLSGNLCPKWPLSPLNPKEHVFFAATAGYLTNQKSKYEEL
jgi:hypothetical protein